ncbi:MAG: hypothetical protein ACM3ST_10520 [Bdellovibrio bacteriovorus]
MILKAIIDDQVYELNVPDALLHEARPFFDQLDRDMDQGWQMSREWVASPDRLQRCQIVANKLLTALETENDRLGRLMAGYILARLPGVESVELDIQGEIQNNHFNLAEHRTPDEAPIPGATAAGRGLSKLEAMEQAGNDVTKVFKVGKAYRFSVFDHGRQQWVDSPLIATEPEAARLRQEAFKERYESLQRPLDS